MGSPTSPLPVSDPVRSAPADRSVADRWDVVYRRVLRRLSSHERRWWVPCAFAGVEDGAIRIEVPHSIFVRQLRARHEALIVRELERAGSPVTRIRFATQDDATPDGAGGRVGEPEFPGFPSGPGASSAAIAGTSGGTAPTPVAWPPPDVGPTESGSFETFVVGESNRYAYGAALELSDPHNAYCPYDPLLIYGSSGVGKTHLLRSVARRLRLAAPAARIIKTKGEAFTRDVVRAATNQTLVDFGDRYAGADALLVDDIQFIAGLDRFGRSSREFLHALTSLSELGKPIVLTADKNPAEIPNIDGRIRARLESGLAQEVREPEWSTRYEIVRQRGDAAGVRMADDVAARIASHYTRSGSSLVGALNRLVATSRSHERPIAMADVDQLLVDLPCDAPKVVPIEDIIAATANELGVPVLRLVGKQRHAEVVLARHIVMYVAREITSLSQTQIATAVRRHASTTAHGWARIERERTRNAALSRTIERLIRRLR